MVLRNPDTGSTDTASSTDGHGNGNGNEKDKSKTGEAGTTTQASKVPYVPEPPVSSRVVVTVVACVCLRHVSLSAAIPAS